MERCGLLLLLLASACWTGGGNPACRVNADCASGLCRVDGTCAANSPGADGGPDSGPNGTSDGGTGVDAGPTDAGNIPADGGLCVPAHDGTIARNRVPLGPGFQATFLVATDAGFATVGTTAADGGRLWDMTGALSGDHAFLAQTQSPGGFWFASSYPNATYVAALSAQSPLLGIYQATSTSLLLLGIASPTNTFPATELAYSPPPVIFAFPLQAQATWTTTSTVTGLLDGVFTVPYSETYAATVDGSGTLKSPYADFEVLRVQLTLTQTVGLLQTVTHSFSFAADCFGPVATVRSKANEPTVEFTSAAELWRLAP